MTTIQRCRNYIIITDYYKPQSDILSILYWLKFW